MANGFLSQVDVVFFVSALDVGVSVFLGIIFSEWCLCYFYAFFVNDTC